MDGVFVMGIFSGIALRVIAAEAAPTSIFTFAPPLSSITSSPVSGSRSLPGHHPAETGFFCAAAGAPRTGAPMMRVSSSSFSAGFFKGPSFALGTAFEGAGFMTTVLSRSTGSFAETGATGEASGCRMMMVSVLKSSSSWAAALLLLRPSRQDHGLGILVFRLLLNRGFSRCYDDCGLTIFEGCCGLRLQRHGSGFQVFHPQV